MPMFDFRCRTCSHTFEALVNTPDVTPPCPVDAGVTEKVWLPGNANSVIGDEIDVSIKHGLCHPDGTPRRFRSRAELKRAEQRAGMMNYVVHEPPPGSDKSKHTSKWI